MAEKFEETNSEIKKEITEEGWEGEAAVLIGKKEDMPRLLEKLESEGKTADLGSYIKLHKEIALPFDEISDGDLKKKLQERAGDCIFDCKRYYDEGHGFMSELSYVDSQGNIAKVNIDSQKIAELDKQIKESGIDTSSDSQRAEIAASPMIWDRLEELGFTNWVEKKDQAEREVIITMWANIEEEVSAYKKRLEDELKKKKKEGFDF